MQQKPVLNSRWLWNEGRYAKLNIFLLLEFEVEAMFKSVTMHLQLYTLISYIFVVQSLHKR